MLKPTGLLAACGVLVVLGGLVFWTNKHPKTDTPATPAAPKITEYKDDQLEGMRIAKPGADPVVMKKVGDRWIISEPQQVDADQDTARTLASNAANLNADRLIDDKATDLKSFGLDQPTNEVDLMLKGGATAKVLLGSDTPSGSDSYVKLDASPKVYTVLSSSKSQFDKSFNDLRDKRMLPFDGTKVKTITVKAKGPEFTLTKLGDGDWQITKPRQYRADGSAVDDFMRKLNEARMDLTQPGTPSGGSVTGAVTVTADNGSQTITVYQLPDKTFYGKSNVGTYRIASDLPTGLQDKDADSFRNKKLFDFGFNDPLKLDLDGKMYERSGEKWKGPSGDVDSGSIQSVIDKLRDLSATKFSDAMAGTKALTLTVISGKTEKVTINKAGDNVYGQKEGDPSVAVIDAKAFDDLQKAIAGIKAAQPPKPDAKK
jgi:hypothetical protein